MKGDVHVMIVRIPIEEMIAEAANQVPEDYQIVDTEMVYGEAAYFSFQKVTTEIVEATIIEKGD